MTDVPGSGMAAPASAPRSRRELRQGNVAAPTSGDKLPLLALISLAAAGFITMMAEAMPVGLLLMISEDFKISEGEAAMFVSVFALGTAGAAVPGAALTRGLPRKPLLLSLMGLFVLTTAITVFTPNDMFAVHLAARLIGGMSAGIMWAMLAGYAVAIAAPDKQGKAMSIAMLGTPLALALGLPLGTYLGSLDGWRTAFYNLLLAAIVMMVVMWFVLPQVPGEPKRGRKSVLSVVMLPGMRTVVGATILFALGHNIVYIYLPMVLQYSNQQDRVDLMQVVFGVAAAVGLYAVGATVDNRLRLLIRSTTVLLVVTLLVMYFSLSSAITIVLLILLWGLAFGGTPTLLQTGSALNSGNARDVGQALVVMAWNASVAFAGGLGGAIERSSAKGTINGFEVNEGVPIMIMVGCLLAAGAAYLVFRNYEAFAPASYRASLDLQRQAAAAVAPPATAPTGHRHIDIRDGVPPAAYASQPAQAAYQHPPQGAPVPTGSYQVQGGPPSGQFPMAGASHPVGEPLSTGSFAQPPAEPIMTSQYPQTDEFPMVQAPVVQAPVAQHPQTQGQYAQPHTQGQYAQGPQTQGQYTATPHTQGHQYAPAPHPQGDYAQPQTPGNYAAAPQTQGHYAQPQTQGHYAAGPQTQSHYTAAPQTQGQPVAAPQSHAAYAPGSIGAGPLQGNPLHSASAPAAQTSLPALPPPDTNATAVIPSLADGTSSQALVPASTDPTPTLSTGVLLRLEEALSEQVKGQHHAISTIAASLRRFRFAESDIRRPLASYLMVGPSRAGAQGLLSTLAETLYGSQRALLRVGVGTDTKGSLRDYLAGSAARPGLLPSYMASRGNAVIVFENFHGAPDDADEVLRDILLHARVTGTDGVQTSLVGCVVVVSQADAIAPWIDESPQADMPDSLVRADMAGFVGQEAAASFDDVVRLLPLKVADVHRLVVDEIQQLAGRLVGRPTLVHVSSRLQQWITDSVARDANGSVGIREHVATVMSGPLGSMAAGFNPQDARPIIADYQVERGEVIVTRYNGAG